MPPTFLSVIPPLIWLAFTCKHFLFLQDSARDVTSSGEHTCIAIVCTGVTSPRSVVPLDQCDRMTWRARQNRLLGPAVEFLIQGLRF